MFSELVNPAGLNFEKFLENLLLKYCLMQNIELRSYKFKKIAHLIDFQ